MLSVIVPVYNTSEFLPRCLDSILGQSYTDIEIICVDDGSTDESSRVLSEYAERDNRIRVITKDNEGLVRARKTGIENVYGEYCTYVDSDDWIESNMYFEMMEVADTYKPDVVTSGIVRNYGDQRIVFENENTISGLYRDEALVDLKCNLVDVEHFYRKNIAVNIINKIIKTSLLRKYQLMVPDEISDGEDIVVSYPCILDASSVYVTGKNYYHYVMRTGSITKQLDASDSYRTKVFLDYVDKIFRDKEEAIPTAMRQAEIIKLQERMIKDPLGTFYYKTGVLYPYGQITENAKCIIYGAGSLGEALMSFLRNVPEIEVVGWSDIHPNPSRGIFGPNEIQKREYDFILVGVLLYDVMNDIRANLKELGVPEDKIRYINI